MKVINLDKYMKIILTIIAIMLSINVAIHLTPLLYAGKYDDVVAVRIVGIDESPREYWDAIPVRIEQ